MDGQRERAPARGVKDSDIPACVDGKRERVAGRGVKDSDIPAQSLGKNQWDVERGRVPVHGGDGLGYFRPTLGYDLWECG